MPVSNNNIKCGYCNDKMEIVLEGEIGQARIKRKECLTCHEHSIIFVFFANEGTIHVAFPLDEVRKICEL